MEELFQSLGIHTKLPPQKSLTSSAQEEVLCSLVHCVLANWHVHPSKLVSHSFSPKCIDFFKKKDRKCYLVGGHSQNYFTCSSIKILVHCYQLWRIFIEICGTIGKQVIKIWPLTKSKVDILELSFTCLYFNGQGVTYGHLWGYMLACPPCPSGLQELCERIAKKSGQIIWGSLLFILEYCSANRHWILAEDPFLLLVEQAHSQYRLKGSPCSGIYV